MTRRKTRTLPSSDESPKTTRRSSRKRNDVDNSTVGDENDKAANCVTKAAAKSAVELAPVASPRSKRAGRHASPPADGNSASTRRSLRRPAPCSSVEEEEVTVPPVKKLRSRASAAAAASNNNSPSAAATVASSAATVIESDESESGFKTDAKSEKHVGNCSTENDDSNDANATSVPRQQQQQQQQKSERTRKRRLADPNENDDAFVTNELGSNCVNNDDETDAAAAAAGKTKPSGKLAKEEASKRRKVASAVNQQISGEKRAEQDNGHEKGDRNHEDGAAKPHGQTNGVEEDPVDGVCLRALSFFSS